MSDITRTITGTKDDIIGELRKKAKYEDEVAAHEREHGTLREAARHLGIARGVEFAIGILEDWDIDKGEK